MDLKDGRVDEQRHTSSVAPDLILDCKMHHFLKFTPDECHRLKNDTPTTRDKHESFKNTNAIKQKESIPIRISIEQELWVFVLNVHLVWICRKV